MSKQLATAIIDASVSVLLVLATRYLSPADTELVKSLVFALQPLALAIIAAQSYTQKAELQARTSFNLTNLSRDVPLPQVQVESHIASALGKEMQ